MQEELTELDAKIAKVKRQEQSLLVIKDQLNKVEKERNHDLARGLKREVQIAFDRYLRTFQTQKRKGDKDPAQQKEISDFRTKWAQYVTDDMPESQDLKPMLGLDAYDSLPKPFRIFSHYDSHSSWRQRSRLLIDHEISKLNRNRVMMRSFVGQQQTFLANLKTATA